MKKKPTLAQTAVAFAFHDGKAHQVLMEGSELLSLLRAHFLQTKGSAIAVREEALEGLMLDTPESLPQPNDPNN